MLDASLRAFHAKLGIASNYAQTTRLPIQRVPLDLVDIGVDIYDRPQQMQSDAAQAWFAMRESAKQDSVSLLVVSAFRSPEYQVEVIQRQLDHGGKIEEILTRVAAPGFSEHHSGCALDITTPGYEAVEEEFEDSPAYRWLSECGSEFAFVMTYPRDNEYGVIYEPWHWCYRG